MRAFQISKHAHPSQVTICNDAQAPIPKNGEVLVDVYAAGMNFLDILQAQGLYQTKPPLPFILGVEYAGIISANSPIPEGCAYKRGGPSPFTPDLPAELNRIEDLDRVFGQAQGSYAEQVAADPSSIIPLPEGLSFEQATAVSMQFMTSYLGLVRQGQAKAGDWVLVHAGAGGVGLAACQIAKVLGCKVIATASTEEKRLICKEKGGADEVVDYGKEGWQKEVLKVTGGRGVDIVYDPVGLLVPSMRCVATYARLLVVGFAGGTTEKVPANLLLLKRVSIVGVYWGGTVMGNPAHAQEIVKKVLALTSSGKLVPVVYEPVYEGLESVSRGLVDLDNRKVWGKAVVRVRQDQSARGARSSL